MEDFEQLLKHAHYLVQNFVETILTIILTIAQVTVVPPLFYFAAVGYFCFRFVFKGDIFIKLGGKTEYKDKSVQKDFDKLKNAVRTYD